MRTVTVNGKRYRIQARQFDATIVDIKGPGLVGGWAQVGSETEDWKERIAAELVRLREASKAFQVYLKAARAAEGLDEFGRQPRQD